MTSPQRRDSDPRIDQIMSTLDDMSSGLEMHVAEYHAFKKHELLDMVNDHRQNLSDVAGLQKDTTLLVNLVAGQPKVDPFTARPTGEREPGIADRVRKLEHAANGGRGLSIRTRDKLIIIVANGVIAALVAWLATGGTL